MYPFKREEYIERHRFWSNKSVDQLSFSNNLVLTISIAIIGYFFDKGYSISILTPSLYIYFKTVFFKFGTVLIAFSIIAGVILSVLRMYDFRVTRNVALTRKWACDNDYLIKDEKLEQKCVLDVFWLIYDYRKYQISKEEVPKSKKSDEYCKLLQKFTELRSYADYLGILSWRFFNWQFFLFLTGIICYVLVVMLGALCHF